MYLKSRSGPKNLKFCSIGERTTSYFFVTADKEIPIADNLIILHK